MTKPLIHSELEHLLTFIGYGSLDADVWFLGMEEAGGGETNLRTRLKFRPVKANAEAHKLLGVTRLHGGKRVIYQKSRYLDLASRTIFSATSSSSLFAGGRPRFQWASADAPACR